MLSAMAQTYDPIEIVVCDNASTDNTAEVARELAKQDPRIHVYVNDSNLGGFNYTMTLRASRGELVKFLNSDDVLEPHCVERMVHEMRQPNVALAFCRAAHIDHTGESVPPLVRDNLLGLNEDKLIDGRELGDQMLSKNANLIGCPTQVMWRRSILGQGDMGFGDRGWHVVGDMAYWLALLSHGDASYIDEELCILRYHEGQESEAIGARVRIAFDCLEMAETAFKHGFLRDQKDQCAATTIALRQLAWRFGPTVPEAPALIQGIRVATERLRVHRGAPPGVSPRHGTTTFLFVVGQSGELARQVAGRWLAAVGDRMDARLILASSPSAVARVQADLLPLREDPQTPLSISAVQVVPVTGTSFVPGPLMLMSAGVSTEEISNAIRDDLTPDDGQVWASPSARGLPDAERVRSLKWWAGQIGFELDSPLAEHVFTGAARGSTS